MLGKYSPLYLVFEFPPLNLFRVPARWIMFFTFSLAILGGWGFQWLIYKIKRLKLKNILISAIFLVAILDLFNFGLNYNAKADAKEWLSPPETLKFLESDQSFYRTLTLGQMEAWNSIFTTRGWQDLIIYKTLLNGLDPNLNLIYRIPNFWVYESIVPKRTNIIKNILDGDIQIKEGKYEVGEKAQKILSQNSVKYLISPVKIKEEGNLKEVFATKTNPIYFVYQNQNNLPRVHFPEKILYASTFEELGQVILDKNFDPKTTAILKNKLAKDNFDTSKSSAEIIKSSNNQISIEASVDSDQLLVLTDSFYPGWKVYVDGKRGEILVANGNQKAIFLEKGNHQIKFIFLPESLRIGMFVSLSALLLVLFLIFIRIKITKN